MKAVTSITFALFLPVTPFWAQIGGGTPKRDYPVKPVPFTSVHVNDTFWAPKIETNRKVTIPFAGPYCASKHALEAVSDALRVEVAPWKIRVVVIEPGPIATHFGARTREVTARILQSAGPYSRFYGNAERASERQFQRGTRQPELVARVIVRAHLV